MYLESISTQFWICFTIETSEISVHTTSSSKVFSTNTRMKREKQLEENKSHWLYGLLQFL
jgi:hypothetical protein